MRIVLLGHPDIASLAAMSHVINALPEQEFAVFLSPAVSTRDAHPAMAALAAFDAGLCRRFFASGVPDALKPANARCLEQPNKGPGLAELRSLEPDLIVSIRFRRILHDAAISVPRLGVINLHSGILPDFRGVMATFWAMLHDAHEIGTTLHYIVDSGIDTGPVIDIERLTVDRRASYLDNVLRLYPTACATIARTVRTLAAGLAPSADPQPQGGAYFSAPGRDDIEAFIARGFRLHDGSEVCPPVEPQA